MVQKLIGKRIKMYRMAKGLTQEELAEKIGLSRNYYSAAERGVYSLNLDKLVEIINILDCSADEIFADVINNGYKVKSSLLSEKIASLSKEDQERILAIVDTLGEDALNLIKENPDNLLLVPGISEVKAKRIYNSIVKYQSTDEIIVNLKKLGFTINESLSILNKWGESSLEIVNNDIYKLIDIIDFTKLDKVFLSMKDK